jgi:hypothetical protein
MGRMRPRILRAPRGLAHLEGTKRAKGGMTHIHGVTTTWTTVDFKFDNLQITKAGTYQFSVALYYCPGSKAAQQLELSGLNEVLSKPVNISE